MKILQICAAYKPAFVYGGPTMSVSRLSECLTAAGIDIQVYATTANGKAELDVVPGVFQLVDNVKTIYFKRLTKDHSHFSPALLKKLWKTAGEFDIIHIHAWWNLVSLFSCLIALILRVPVVVSPRGTLSPYSFGNKNVGIKWFIHQFFSTPMLNRSHIHVTSKREYEAVGQLIKPKSIVTIPNFVKLSDYKIVKPEPVNGSTFKLLFFSRIEEKKGLDLLINALPYLTFPYSLTIAGTGNKDYIESLKAVAAENNLEDKITWVGFQSDNKFRLLAEHDLFVLPSYDENFGNAVIESLSAGTPVLVTEQVGLADYVSEKQLGFICKTEPLAISAELNEIILHKRNELQKIRNIAPNIIYDDFNDENLVKRYISMYQKITKNE